MEETISKKEEKENKDKEKRVSLNPFPKGFLRETFSITNN